MVCLFQYKSRVREGGERKVENMRGNYISEKVKKSEREREREVLFGRKETSKVNAVSN